MTIREEGLEFPGASPAELPYVAGWGSRTIPHQVTVSMPAGRVPTFLDYQHHAGLEPDTIIRYGRDGCRVVLSPRAGAGSRAPWVPGVRGGGTSARLQHADQACEAVLAVAGGDALAEGLQDGGRE
ncbi:hypothetical protein SAMN05421869_123149 [Nonomuraea jiangxiensis]|uniref:Uncharacterized protein n=1 Tax=Nonomuraea jiangxiensis TaxID=633440 RepID=A0A1G9ICL2_9ACTN|nr:hypothetical protein SAMN05421869_123149 [Nonomuraea jiangxiensis]